MTIATSFPPIVLVVDDEPLIRMNAIDILEEAGFGTFEANSAEEALISLAAHPDISVLFTDINMPGAFDGLELARQVHDRRPDVQLILTSGRSPPAQRDIPDDGKFVAKPYVGRTITDLIDAASSRR